MPELPDVEVFEQYVDSTSLYQDIASSEVRRSVTEYAMADGRKPCLIGAGDGHPGEIMYLTFAIQALCSHQIDDEVARIKLDAVGMRIDELSEGQRAFLASWRE